MTQYKTLREVCDCLQISRRTIQGYEKIGLLTPSGKNKYGYLLYDEETMNLIIKIKQYQQFGFRLKEIKELLTASDAVIKEALQEKIIRLEKQSDELDQLIELANEIVATLEK